MTTQGTPDATQPDPAADKTPSTEGAPGETGSDAPKQKAPYAIFETSEKLNERLERARTDAVDEHYKSIGLKDAKELQAKLQELQEIKAQEEARQQESMTDLEKERAQREAAEKELVEIRAKSERDAFDAHVLQMCADRGIKNWKYARYSILQELDELPEDGELDEAQFLDTLMSDETARVALGIAAVKADASGDSGKRVAAQTTPDGTEPKPTPNSAGMPKKKKNAMEMTKEEWRAHLESIQNPA